MSHFLILGAGLSGLCAAQFLRQNGHNATLVDKGRGLGGRMATRRFEGAIFDHGAQFFTARSPEFQNEVARWIENGAAAPYFEGFPTPDNRKPDDHYPRFRGSAGMTSIAKFLARDLEVHLGEEIEFLKRENGVWRAQSASGRLFEGEKLILTAPVPQSLALLQNGGFELPNEARETLQTLKYEPCFACLAVLDGPSKISAPGLFYLEGEPIYWIADNFQKGISPREGALTIHSSAAFARENYERDQTEVGQMLLEAARPFLGEAKVEKFDVRRWRYSKPENPLQIGALTLPEFDLAFAGDALNGAKVEGAWLSGLEAARELGR